MIDRKWKEFFYKDLKPYEHYIPVKEDLSDFSEQITWAETHQEEALKIARNAQNYAIENLSREKAIQYLENVLLDLAKEPEPAHQTYKNM